LNVTFFCCDASSLALDLPKERALLPPLCICRMKKTQNPMRRMKGAQEMSMLAQAGVWSRSMVTATFLARSVSTNLS
jgi:hypothetical protein